MAQPVAHRRELSDAQVQFIRATIEERSVDARRTFTREHLGDLREGEPGRPPEGDERETFEDVRRERPPGPDATGRSEQPLRFVEAQR